MPVKKEEEAWLLGNSLPLSWGSSVCVSGGFSARTRPQEAALLTTLTLRKPWGGGTKQQSQEDGGGAEVVVSDCIDRVVGEGRGEAKRGRCRRRGRLYVSVCMSFEERRGGGGAGRGWDPPPEPIPGPSRRGPARAIRGPFDPCETQPECPGTTRQLLYERDGQQTGTVR